MISYGFQFASFQLPVLDIRRVRVSVSAPFDRSIPLDELAAPLVNLQVRRIFGYRAKALKRAFGAD